MQTSGHAPIALAPVARAINLIVIHCSASPDGQSLARMGEGHLASAAEVIDAWHKARGFKRAAAAVAAFQPHLPHIGYQHVIDVDGSLEMGRDLGEVGAHAQGFNAESVGICLVGTSRFTRRQWRTLKALLVGDHNLPMGDVFLTELLHIPVQPPQRIRDDTGVHVRNGICGHRDLSPDQDRDGIVEPFEWLKTCPGFDVASWIASGFIPPANAVFSLADGLHRSST